MENSQLQLSLSRNNLPPVPEFQCCCPESDEWVLEPQLTGPG